jgi:hypothetical protein
MTEATEGRGYAGGGKTTAVEGGGIAIGGNGAGQMVGGVLLSGGGGVASGSTGTAGVGGSAVGGVDGLFGPGSDFARGIGGSSGGASARGRGEPFVLQGAKPICGDDAGRTGVIQPGESSLCHREPGHEGAHSNGKGLDWSAAPPLGPKPEWSPPAEWQPKPYHVEGAAVMGLDVAHQAEVFRSYEQRRPVHDWDRAFERWLTQAAEARGGRSMRDVVRELVEHGIQLGRREASDLLESSTMRSITKILDRALREFPPPEQVPPPESWQRAGAAMRDALTSWHTQLETLRRDPVPTKGPEVVQRLTNELKSMLTAPRQPTQPPVRHRRAAAFRAACASW